MMLELRRQKGGDPGKMEADMKLIEEQVRSMVNSPIPIMPPRGFGMTG